MQSMWQVFEGECIDVMRSLAPESVDAVITSPPYAMQRRDTYGGVPEPEYPAWTVAWMREARRVLRPNGSVVVNVRPHIRHGELSDYVLRTRLAVRADGWTECEELIWHKTNPMPMGPTSRPRRAWESLLWYAKHGKPFSDPKGNGIPSTRQTAVWDSGQHVHTEGFTHYTNGGRTGSTPKVVRSTNVVSLSLGSETTGHPASYPWQLAEWIGRLVCPPGGTVLDPFSGSASTGAACLRNGWRYVGIESMTEYAHMSRRRLAALEKEPAPV